MQTYPKFRKSIKSMHVIQDLCLAHTVLMTTCVENVGELLAAEISTNAGFADCVVTEVAADEVTTLTTPPALLITTVSVLLDVGVVVQRVAFLHRQTRRYFHQLMIPLPPRYYIFSFHLTNLLFHSRLERIFETSYMLDLPERFLFLIILFHA